MTTTYDDQERELHSIARRLGEEIRAGAAEEAHLRRTLEQWSGLPLGYLRSQAQIAAALNHLVHRAEGERAMARAVEWSEARTAQIDALEWARIQGMSLDDLHAELRAGGVDEPETAGRRMLAEVEARLTAPAEDLVERARRLAGLSLAGGEPKGPDNRETPLRSEPLPDPLAEGWHVRSGPFALEVRPRRQRGAQHADRPAATWSIFRASTALRWRFVARGTASSLAEAADIALGTARLIERLESQPTRPADEPPHFPFAPDTDTTDLGEIA